MPLWRREGFVDDKWTLVAGDDPVPDEGPILVSLKRWLLERSALESRASPVGVAVEAGVEAQEHLADLAARPLAALGFAKFADGRAYSYARLLRDRYGFKGELRALGDVLIDEIPLMLRCGFNSFAVTNPATIAKLETGQLPGPTIHYQPGSDHDEVPVGSTSWRTATQATKVRR